MCGLCYLHKYTVIIYLAQKANVSGVSPLSDDARVCVTVQPPVDLTSLLSVISLFSCPLFWH